jgi:hypothetical protein
LYLRLSVIDLLRYGVALLDMRKFTTQVGIFILLLFHFGCSGVQQRTAFGGGDFNPGKPIFHIDTVKEITKSSGTKDLGLSHSSTVILKSDFNRGTFDLGEKVEQKIHRMNQKVWFESGKLPKGIEKLKPIKKYKDFLKSGKTKSNWESDNKGTTLMIVGLVLGLLGYLMIVAADSGWFGLGLGGSNFSGCFVVLLGLVFLISAVVLLIVGLVTALT